MFSNSHLSNLVNQLGMQQHQLQGQLGERANSTTPTLSLGVGGNSCCNQYELPRQTDPADYSPMATMQQQLYRTQQTPSFCAIGNKLSMATYARKENQATNELEQIQTPKMLRGRSRKGKSREIKWTLAKMAAMQAKNLKSLNSDLYPAVGIKNRALTVTGTNNPQSTQGGGPNQTLNINTNHRQIQLGGMAPTTNKTTTTKGSSAPLQLNSEVLKQMNSTLTKDNDPSATMDIVTCGRNSQKDLITMNIELKTQDCRFTRIRANSRLSEMAGTGLNERVSQVGARNSTGNQTSEGEPVQMQIMLCQSPSQKKVGALGTKLTIKKSRHDVIATKELISEFDRSSVRSARSRDNFATSSVVTQPNNLNAPDDFPPTTITLQNLPTSNQCSIPGTKESDIVSKDASPQNDSLINHAFKLAQLGPEQNLVLMNSLSGLRIISNRSSISSTNSQDFVKVIAQSHKISSRTSTPPKQQIETKETDVELPELGEKTDRPRTTLSSKKPSMQVNGASRTKAEFGIVTQMMVLSPSTHNALNLKSSSLSNATTVLQVVGQIINKQSKSTTAVKRLGPDQQHGTSQRKIPAGDSSFVIKEMENNNSIVDISRLRKLTQFDKSQGDKAKDIVDDRTSRNNIHMALSPNNSANFSSIERQQTQALINMAQEKAEEKQSKGLISLNKQWQGKRIQQFMNKEKKLQAVGNITGMKGSKLPMNSQFRKMHNFLRKRGQDSTLGSSNNILLAQAATYSPPPTYQRMPNSGRKAAQLDRAQRGASTQTRNVACDAMEQTDDAPAEPARGKQSILVLQKEQQNRNLVDEETRNQNNDTVIDTHMPGKLNNYSIDNMLVRDISQNGRGMATCQRAEMKSQISSHEGYEPLEATMVATGTQILKKPVKNTAAISQTTDRELPHELLQFKRAGEQKSHSPLAKYFNPIQTAVNGHQALCQDDARRASGGHLFSNTVKAFVEVQRDAIETTIGKHSSQTPMNDEVATYNRMSDQGIDIESIRGLNETVTNMQAEVVAKDKIVVITSGAVDPASNAVSCLHSVDPTLASNNNLPPSMIDFQSLATIGYQNKSNRRVNSQVISQQPYQQTEDLNTDASRQPSEFRVNNRGLFPHMRRVRMNRWTKSQHMRRRNKTQQLQQLGEVTQMVIGKRFKPKLVFKEQEIQSLYDRAEQPIQQVVEKIILDDLDQFNGFGYASKKLASRRATPQPISPAIYMQHSQANNDQVALSPRFIQQAQGQLTFRPQKNNEYLKYEFIERLLRTPDLDKTQKTLQEMMNLYQELLENNLSEAGAASAGMRGGDSQAQVNSQQSIVIHTDRKPQTLLNYNKAGVKIGSKRGSDLASVRTFKVKRKFEQDHESSLYMKKLESQGILPTRGSIQIGNVSVMTAMAADPQTTPGTRTNMKKNYQTSMSSGIGYGGLSGSKNHVQVDMMHGLPDMKMEDNELNESRGITGSFVVDIGNQKRQDQSDVTIGIRPSTFKYPITTIDCQNILQKDEEDEEEEKQILMLSSPANMDKVDHFTSAGFDEKTDSEDRTHIALMVPLQLGKQPTLERELCASLGSSQLQFGGGISPQPGSGRSPILSSQTPPSCSPRLVKQKTIAAKQQMAKILLSYTTKDAQETFDSAESPDQQSNTFQHKMKVDTKKVVPNSELARAQEIRSKSLNRVTVQRANELKYTGLSHRIRILEEQIILNSRQPKVKTATDVRNAVQVLGFYPTASVRTVQQRNNSVDLELQMARSAYLCFQASKLNSGKVIVGNELRNTSQRMKFIEQMFPAGRQRQFNRTNSTVRTTKSPMPHMRNRRTLNVSAATST